MNRHIKSGSGWRLGWNSIAEEYCGLVAGERWAIELTATEFYDFCRCTRSLAKTMQSMASQLMDEETLVCEQETSTVWLEVDGFPTAFSLRFILLSGRKGEGEWPPIAASELISALAEAPFSTLGNGG